MQARIVDHSAQVLSRVDGEIRRRLNHVGVFLAGQVRRNISESTRANGPSLPGEFPHADTGLLRSSVSHVVGEDEQSSYVAIGTNVFYGAIHEGSPHNPGLRPFLSRTLIEEQAMVRRLMAAV